MRHTFLIMVVAALGGGFALASCGGSGKSSGDMGADMAGGGVAQDMSIVKVNCLGISSCVYTCLSGGTDLNTCATQCEKNAKPGSSAKWEAAVGCGQNYCTGNKDLGTDKCDEVAVPGMAGAFQLCDPGITYAQCTDANYMSTVCSPCIQEARNFWFFDVSTDPNNPGPPTGMCPTPTSADCMGAQAACMSMFSACLNDM